MNAAFGKWAANEGLVILIAGLFAIVEFAVVGGFVTQDTWLALLAGREVANEGLPSYDTLTAWTLGDEWIDQQWLGQLALYGLHSLGSLELVAFVHAALVSLTFAAVLVGARTAGATTRSAAYFGALAFVPCLIVAANIRTQTLAFPMFALLMWLLLTDSRQPSARVYWTIPLLALWANLHGSVTLGAGFVGLAALLPMATAGDARTRSAAVRHGLPMIILAPLAVFASPYAADLPTYYSSTLLNADFGDIVSEWMGPEFSIEWAPFYALAGVALLVIGRWREELTYFELSAVVLTLIFGMLAIRNLAWFALTTTLILPAAVSRARSSRSTAGPVRLATLLTGTMAIGLLTSIASGIADVQRKVDEAFPPKALAVIATAATSDAEAQIFAESRFADWILWHQPSLRGRILFDIRFELLSGDELRRIVRFNLQAGDDWRAAAGGARLVVLDPDDRPLKNLPTTGSVLVRDGQAHRLFRSRRIDVVQRDSPSR